MSRFFRQINNLATLFFLMFALSACVLGGGKSNNEEDVDALLEIIAAFSPDQATA